MSRNKLKPQTLLAKLMKPVISVCRRNRIAKVLTFAFLTAMSSQTLAFEMHTMNGERTNLLDRFGGSRPFTARTSISTRRLLALRLMASKSAKPFNQS